jgi:two-component system NarL family sensor kinase
MRRLIPDVRRYSLAISAALAALLLRKILTPLFGHENPYLTTWAAIVISAWYCGIGPSVVCTVISVLGVCYWFLPRFNSFVLENPKSDLSGMALFSVLSGLIIALGEANRRSKARLEREVAERARIEDELRTTQAQLEGRVHRRTAQLHVANENLTHEAARVKAQAQWLDAASDAIFVGGADEIITYWNQGAERLYGWTRAEAVGKSPHELLQTRFPLPLAEIIRLRQQDGWQGELVHTKRDGTTVTVTSRWTALKDENNNPTGWLEINRDITDRKTAEAARQFSAQLLKLQDEERRRVARDLHDSTGQIVIALILNLGQLIASAHTPEEKRILANSDKLLQQLSSELRSISYLLHPPLLDEVGLWTALEWYVEGFKQRSGIAATLERDSNFGRLDSDLEVAIFRVVQECLTNVQRHSGSPDTSVRLLRSFEGVRLEVQDRGKGIPAEKQWSIHGNSNHHGATGVGLRGMRERVLQLGGDLSVESNGGGTTIIATFPISVSAAASNKDVAVA